MIKSKSVLFKFVKVQVKRCSRIASTKVSTDDNSTKLSLRQKIFLNHQQRYKDYDHVLFSSHLEYQTDYMSYGMRRALNYQIKKKNRLSSVDTEISYKNVSDIPWNWMDDIEYYDQSNDMRKEAPNMDNILGTADPKLPKSNVPCSGCGAILHCNHQTSPGRNV